MRDCEVMGATHEPTHPWPLPGGELVKRAPTLAPLLRRGRGWVHGPNSRPILEVFASHEPAPSPRPSPPPRGRGCRRAGEGAHGPNACTKAKGGPNSRPTRAMIVGIPKEIKDQEYRVALLPSAAYQLIKRGHQVVVERGAGAGAGYPDGDYEQAGAKLVDG